MAESRTAAGRRASGAFMVKLRQTARCIFRSQGGNNLLQARPFQYFGQTMESQVNPVVRDAALRKIICPNTFGAIAGANHCFAGARLLARGRSEEHTSELQSLMRISYAVFCLKKKINTKL